MPPTQKPSQDLHRNLIPSSFHAAPSQDLFRNLLKIYKEMEQDLFKYLPLEIITNILSRLPVETIAISKCVCKPWLDLLETDYFINSHLSKSVPSLAVMNLRWPKSCCLVLEFEDQHLDDVETDHFQYKQVIDFHFPQEATILGAANGLLLLSKYAAFDFIIICNPIIRHYVEICSPRETPFDSLYPSVGGGAFGFGVSRITGQYKVVLICPQSRFASESKCRVYTLGTGLWRRVGLEAARASLFLKLGDSLYSAFLDGNLHWTVTESPNMDKPLITCFDLETECFSSFGAPASRGGLSVLNDCLCFCEWKDGIVVWLMKEYGVEKSWSKDYVITQSVFNYEYGYRHVFPIKVFENGDMLFMLSVDMCVRYYFNKTKTVVDYGIPDECHRFTFLSSMLFTPSSQTLKGFVVGAASYPGPSHDPFGGKAG